MRIEQPFVSIIIPSYNRSELIQETLDSVYSQSYQNWECTVVDDGSTDGTQEIITRYVMKDERFCFFQRNREPKGAPTCRNIGIEKSAGDYIIFLDSDDLLADNCLENRIEFIKDNPRFDFWVFRTAQFNILQGDSKTTWNLLNKDTDDLQRFILQDMPWHTMGPIWLKKTLNEIGGFDESAICWQDWELHIRALLKNYKYWKSDDYNIDTYYRNNKLNKQNAISSNQTEIYQILYRIELFEDIYYKVIFVDQRKEIKFSFGVLFFRLFLELYNHQTKNHLVNLYKILKRLKIFTVSEIFLLRLLISILSFNKYKAICYNIIINILNLLNKGKFNNTTNKTFQC